MNKINMDFTLDELMLLKRVVVDSNISNKMIEELYDRLRVAIENQTVIKSN